MAEDPERDGRAEFEVYDAPSEVVIERVTSNHEVRCSEYDGDEKDSAWPPDTTVMGEPYGITGRPPAGIEYIAIASKSGDDWLLVANPDRPAVAAEGATTVYEMYESGGTWVTGATAVFQGDIFLNPRTGQKVATTGPTYLGSGTATIPLIKGGNVAGTLTFDLAAFLASWQAAVTALQSDLALGATAEQALASIGGAPPSGSDYVTLVTAAITALQGLVAGWVSANHKMDA